MMATQHSKAGHKRFAADAGSLDGSLVWSLSIFTQRRSRSGVGRNGRKTQNVTSQILSSEVQCPCCHEGPNTA